MEQTALILISIALFLLIIIVSLLTVLIFRFLKQNEQTTQNNQNEEVQKQLTGPITNKNFHPEIQTRIREIEKIKRKNPDLYCPNHPDEIGEVTCAICDTLFCKSCIKPFKNLHFCKEHIPLIMKFDWVEVLTVKTSTTDPEEGVRLYDVKKEIFQNDGFPTYIETHYKINVDQDHIETYLVLYSMIDNLDKIKTKLQSFQI